MAQITTTLRRLFNELSTAERVTHDPRLGQTVPATITHSEASRLGGAAAPTAHKH